MPSEASLILKWKDNPQEAETVMTAQITLAIPRLIYRRLALKSFRRQNLTRAETVATRWARARREVTMEVQVTVNPLQTLQMEALVMMEVKAGVKMKHKTSLQRASNSNNSNNSL